MSRIASILAALAIGFLLAPLSHAAEAAASCPPTPKPFDQAELRAGMTAAQDRGMMWRLEKAGRISWLYGTIHVARREWIFPGAQTLWALRSVERIAVELDVTQPAILAELLASMKAGPDTPPVPPALTVRLAAQAKVACVGPEFAWLRPDAQAVTLVSMAGRTAGLDYAYGIDNVFIGFGRAQNKPVISLETVQQQVDFLLSSDSAAIEAKILETVEALEKDEVARGLEAMAEAWAAGRLEELARISEEADTLVQRATNAEAMATRNLVMAKEIAAIHDGGHSVFAAVGALHMEGEQGLPALLAGRGFEVTRVRFARLREAETP